MVRHVARARDFPGVGITLADHRHVAKAGLFAENVGPVTFLAQPLAGHTGFFGLLAEHGLGPRRPLPGRLGPGRQDIGADLDLDGGRDMAIGDHIEADRVRQGQIDRRPHTGRARLAVVNVNQNVPESHVFLLPNRDGRLPGCAGNHGGFPVACIS